MSERHAAVRVSAVAALSAHLSSIHAHAAEHACSALALSQGVSYARLVFRILHLLEAGHINQTTFSELGPRVIVGAPLETLARRVPVREAIEQREDVRKQSTALLRHLMEGESMEIPDAGLRCKKCGCTDIRYDFLQTRSADEPMSCFCSCERCGKRWRM